MAEALPFPFATIDELKARWPDLPPGADGTATVNLEDASQFILDVCPAAADASPATRRRIVCAVVKRSMDSPLPAGLTTGSETAGGVSMNFTAANPNGDFYLTKQEKQALGCGKSKAFGVQIATYSASVHRPWCNLNFGATYCSCGVDIAGEPIFEGA